MIISFRDKKTEKLYVDGKAKFLPNELIGKALRKLDIIDASISLNDLKSPPGNNLHKLKDDLEGFYSIKINDKYRIIFKFKNENAYEVEVIDYH